MGDLDATTTVAELVALADRAAKAMAEVGAGELGEQAHVVVTRDGTINLAFCSHKQGQLQHEAVEKLLSIDPVFEATEATS